MTSLQRIGIWLIVAGGLGLALSEVIIYFAPSWMGTTLSVREFAVPAITVQVVFVTTLLAGCVMFVIARRIRSRKGNDRSE